MAKMIRKKILPKYFNEVVNGRKNFELRKDEDDVQVGDKIALSEWDGKTYTNRYVTKEVTYVLRDCEEYGLMKGYCIIGLGETSDYNFFAD